MPYYIKSNNNDCSNSSTVILLTSAYKIYFQITKTVAHLLLHEETEFRKCKSITDSMFTTEQITQNHKDYNK
jgi:hypothetical protein